MANLIIGFAKFIINLAFFVIALLVIGFLFSKDGVDISLYDETKPRTVRPLENTTGGLIKPNVDTRYYDVID